VTEPAIGALTTIDLRWDNYGLTYLELLCSLIPQFYNLADKFVAYRLTRR
jgi:hypothetical protein